MLKSIFASKDVDAYGDGLRVFAILRLVLKVVLNFRRGFGTHG